MVNLIYNITPDPNGHGLCVFVETKYGLTKDLVDYAVNLTYEFPQYPVVIVLHQGFSDYAVDLFWKDLEDHGIWVYIYAKMSVFDQNKLEDVYFDYTLHKNSISYPRTLKRARN